MSVTRLKRKHRKNIARANNKVQEIKDLLRTPTLKNVDLEELKSRFGQTSSSSANTAKTAPAPAEESLLDKAKKAVSSAADKVKEVAGEAVEAVTHSSIVERAQEAVSGAVEAVTHSAAFEAVKDAAENLVEGAKHVLEGDDSPKKSEDTAQNAAETNQTGSEGYDAAEAETKPVNEDGEEGDKPKPEIAL